MATFANLLTTLRRDILGEPLAAYSQLSDATDLLPVLYDSSAEIAAQLGFPVVLDATATAAVGATSIAAPANMVWPLTVTVNGDELGEMSFEFVKRKQKLTTALWPRYFAFDPKRGGSIEVGPPLPTAAVAGDIYVEYVKALDTSAYTTATAAWEGLFPDFHYIIPLRAAVKMWEGLQDPERAQYWSQRFNVGVQAFSTRLGRTDVANLIVPRENRHDEGAS